jgi:hypothetical protein
VSSVQSMRSCQHAEQTGLAQCYGDTPRGMSENSKETLRGMQSRHRSQYVSANCTLRIGKTQYVSTDHWWHLDHRELHCHAQLIVKAMVASHVSTHLWAGEQAASRTPTLGSGGSSTASPT